MRRIVIAARLRAQEGYTFIELLVVVVVVIGILAAIALPAFLGQKEKAGDSGAKVDARTAYTAIQTFRTENETYAATAADLRAIEPSLSSASNLQAAGTALTFRISVESTAGHEFWIERRAGTPTERGCLPAGAGGCPVSGQW